MARRSYGSGRLFVRSDSNGRETWYGSWRVGGRRVKRRIGLKRRASTAEGLTRTQAEAELRRLMATEVVLAGPQRKTIEEAGALYVEHLEHVMERKRTTIHDYREYLRRHLVPFFGARPMDKIDRAFVENYLLAKKREGLSSKTVCNHLNFLHGLWSFAIKREWALKNPVALVDRPRMPRFKERRIQFLTREELDAVVRAVPGDVLGSVEAPLYLTAAMTGLRQGELIALRWIDVDWSASRIRIADSYVRSAFDSPKDHRGRSVPMADRLAGELERHFQASRWRAENDLVFAHPATGHVLDASKLRKRFYVALERAGVHAITFHGLRHTFGTQMAAAGAPMRAIQEWMGHADISTTEIYAHYAPDALRARPHGRGGVRAEGVRGSGGGAAGGGGAAAWVLRFRGTNSDETSMFVRLDSLYESRQNVAVRTMPGLRYTQLAQRAAESYGYLSGEDARGLGVPMGTLNALARRGQLERVEHGIYRVPLIPTSPLDDYMLATLWPGGHGRISHESALGLYDMSDANPAKIHITVPPSYRTHRDVPTLYVLHHEDLDAADEGNFEGIPVVSPAKAIRQAHARHVRRSLLGQAIEDGVRGGWLRGRQADELRAEIGDGVKR